MLKKYADILSTWMNSEIQDALQEAIIIHLPNNKWRLINGKKLNNLNKMQKQ